MTSNGAYFLVDPQGNLVVPAELAERFGLQPGARVKFDEGPGGLLLRRPLGHLARVYLEPTTECNLACGTCIRHAWSEPGGRMSEDTFRLVLEGLRSFRPRPDGATCSTPMRPAPWSARCIAASSNTTGPVARCC